MDGGEHEFDIFRIPYSDISHTVDVKYNTGKFEVCKCLKDIKAQSKRHWNI